MKVYWSGVGESLSLCQRSPDSIAKRNIVFVFMAHKSDYIKF